MGLAYLASSGSLLVADSEVDEMTLFADANVFVTSTAGALEGSFSTAAYTREPADVAVGARGRVLLFVDDVLDLVFKVRAGVDRRWGTSDDLVSSFSTRSFGSHDPEGLGYGDGSLFLTDGNGTQVFRVDPGPNKKFDGAPPLGDDVVTSFDTTTLGLRDPEDVAYDPHLGRLFLVSRTEDVIVITTTAGALVDSIDIPSPDLRPAGIALAPGSDDPTATHVYVADRGKDNGPHPAENDGRILEFALAPGPSDPAPPSAPAELEIATSSTGVLLDWADNAEPDLAGYELYRGNGSGGWTRLNEGLLTASTYADGTAPTGATSDYRVIAVDTGGNASDPSVGSAWRTPIALRAASSADVRSSRRLTIAHPKGAVPGDVLVANIGLRRTARVSAPAGWDLVRSDQRGTEFRELVYVRVLSAGDPSSSSWVFSKRRSAAGLVVAYEGVDRTHPIEAVDGSPTDGSTAITAPSVRATDVGGLLVAIFGVASRAHVNIPPGMVARARAWVIGGASPLSMRLADDVIDEAGSTGPRVATVTSAGAGVGQVVLLRPAT
jgi:hypothetical protein